MKKSVIVETTEPSPGAAPYARRGEVKVVIVVEAESLDVAEADLAVCYAQARTALSHLPAGGSRIPLQKRGSQPSPKEAIENVHAATVGAGGVEVQVILDAEVGHIDIDEIPKPRPRDPRQG